jgi:hypothetical protein
VDVYSVELTPGQRLRVRVKGRLGGAIELLLWRPGTKTVLGNGFALPIGVSIGPGKTQHLSYRATQGGRYYVELRLRRPGGSPGGTRYALQLTKSS